MSMRFIDALLAAGRPVIMEVKRRGARGEDLFRNRSVPELVAMYEGLAAPCLSVVTGRWFGGDEDLLREVAGLTRLPILRKDFVTRADQIARTADLGASAVLLTARILPRATLPRLVETALEHGLAPFVEVAGAEELDGRACGADCIVAVNNKDIASRERGPAAVERSLALLPLVRRTGTRCPVSAGGIVAPETAAALVGSGFRGLLIGTGLLLARDPSAWLASFDRQRRPARAA